MNIIKIFEREIDRVCGYIEHGELKGRMCGRFLGFWFVQMEGWIFSSQRQGEGVFWAWKREQQSQRPLAE